MSALTDAIIANITAAQDPTARAHNQMLTNFANTQQQELRDRKAQSIVEYGSMIKKLKDDNADPAVITAFERLLAQTTSES